MLRAWQERRAAARLERLRRDADYWRQEATRLSLLAYGVPDIMAEPMRWGRLQNAANWAKHRERECRAAIAKATK